MFLNVPNDKLRVVMVAEKAGPVQAGTVGDQGGYTGPKVLADYGFDDAPHLDLLGAQRAGIHAVLIDRRGKLAPEHRAVKDLRDLPRIAAGSDLTL